MRDVAGQLIAKLDVLETMRVNMCKMESSLRLQFSELAKDDPCECATIVVHKSGYVFYCDISGTNLDFLDVPGKTPIDTVVEEIEKAFANLIPVLKQQAMQQEIATQLRPMIVKLENHIKGVRAMQDLATQLVGRIHMPAPVCVKVEEHASEAYVCLTFDEHASIDINEQGKVVYHDASDNKLSIDAGTSVDEIAKMINQAFADYGKWLSGC
jgi:hypothetical protein